MNQPTFRDVEQLSAYLDGQLPPAEAARLETRLKTDPQLHSGPCSANSPPGALPAISP